MNEQHKRQALRDENALWQFKPANDKCMEMFFVASIPCIYCLYVKLCVTALICKNNIPQNYTCKQQLNFKRLDFNC